MALKKRRGCAFEEESVSRWGSMEVEAEPKVENNMDGIVESEVMESEVDPVLQPEQSEEIVVDEAESVERLPVVAELKTTHRMQRERLGLWRQLVETLRLVVLSLLYQCRLLWIHALSHHLRFVAAGVLTIAIIVALAVLDGPHECYVREAIVYFRFGG
jgi:hypothetical protein